ncbi:Cytochrome P450 [Macrophomina phaseolina MS6]|uniref:Cytochrome P450 n=1 Tax=Macrophomina phaseolina (strain MS6) TaxID=1126212 RepID=K2RNF5_MACPH|nr:Cytochrome P450 [Macrophomina phaseolina MS6]
MRKATAVKHKFISGRVEEAVKSIESGEESVGTMQKKRQSTYLELAKANISYLDAVVDEVLRLANTIAVGVYVGPQDTAVLGHRIPKATDVLLMG